MGASARLRVICVYMSKCCVHVRDWAYMCVTASVAYMCVTERDMCVTGQACMAGVAYMCVTEQECTKPK